MRSPGGTTTTTTINWRSRPAFVLLLAVAACGGDDLLLPSAGQPARITVVSGNGQTGTVGQPLLHPLVVEVTDPEDRPVQNVQVAFVAPEGSTVTPQDTVITGPDGRASVHYTLATASGQQTIEARAEPVAPSPDLTTTFSASAEPESAVQLVLAGGDKQEGEVPAALAESLAVKAVDRFGNGVAGVEVSWDANGGSVSPVSVATGADGRAATQRTLGARPGRYLTIALAPGLEGSPVEFEATGIAPPSPQLVLLTQPSSSASAGTPFERQPVIQLLDAVGAPLARADVAVTVQVAEGTGSLGGGTTVRSNAEGRVTFTDLSIRGRPGERTLLFAAADFTPAVSETIDVNPGPPAPGRSSASVPNGTAGSPTTISIRLADAFGTAVEGRAGALTVRVSGANSGELPVAEEGDGSYSASYTPIVSGTDQVEVLVNGEAIPGSPLATAVAPGAADPGRTTVEISRSGIFNSFIHVLVTVRDGHGNLLGRGGDQVQVQYNGGTLHPALDRGDGTYEDTGFVGFGSSSVIVMLNGVAVAGSPFTG